MKNENNAGGAKAIAVVSLYPVAVILAMYIVVCGLTYISLMVFSIATDETFAVAVTHMLDWMPSLLNI
jgi:hypothetical protein